MNTTNGSFDEEPAYTWATLTTFMLETYIDRIVGGVGILMNLFFVVLLSHQTLRHQIYKFFWVR